ncbi:unnamed protein product [Clonostachys rosea]|uniref:DUF1365 domain-containing protein n=1 Tax=Bionectria ochroleuca TaxID=29856 RepID=A0ABY6UP04_BIOOC|nr:unnamed protein product [Clonostachys rosea]
MAFPSIFYTPLAFSCLFRQVLERRISLSSTELVLQVVLVRWAGLNFLTCAATLTAFLFLAFCQTKAEYWDTSQNLREIEASREASRAPAGPGINGRRLVKQAPSADNETQETLFELEGLHGRPIMYPSILRHIRTAGGFKDDFSHSYLYIGVPVGIHATYSPMISMDRPSWKVLWNIRPQDQAIRGGKDLTLSHKLEECLRAQNEDPREWAYAYLLTSPCMNDHNNNNNPLAFWYLYNSDKELTALILQLDTSYGERRLWFVRNSLQKQAKGSPYCFQGKFVKDLQVSPFMPLGSDTSYIVDTSDPCASTNGRVNILITLKKGDKTLMTASVKPHSPSLDIPTASTWSSLIFLWKWWWVPMATVVTCRILGQAAKIYLTQRKKIKVQTREEPIKTVTAKPARTVEMYVFLTSKPRIETNLDLGLWSGISSRYSKRQLKTTRMSIK